MSVLKHLDVDTAQRDEYLRVVSNMKRMSSELGRDVTAEETGVMEILTPELFNQMAEDEEFILTVTSNGYGKRTSAYEYRVTGRGGQGIANIEVGGRNKGVAGSFPVADTNQIMMVTDAGKLIRMPIHNIIV